MINVRENYFYFKALKVNQPPQAIVNPPTQVVTLPTKKAIIDGSSSTDDEDVSQLTYKWEIRKNPIKYEIPTQHSTDPTLTLDNLVAGNYTIRLTVTDAKGRKFKHSDLLQCFISIFRLFCTSNVLIDTLSSMPF